MSEEQKPPTENEAHGENAKAPTMPKKKKKSFGIFKAALFMLKKKKNNGSKSSRKSIAKEEPAVLPEAAANNWTKLVDSMRPLHLQDESQPPSPPSLAVAVEVEDVIVRPPYSPSAASTSTAGTMSKYASAQSLRDLYNSSDDEDDDDDDDPDAMFDALCGDEMIDAKADEFIARFYKQIHMQNSTATAHGHHRGGTI